MTDMLANFFNAQMGVGDLVAWAALAGIIFILGRPHAR